MKQKIEVELTKEQKEALNKLTKEQQDELVRYCYQKAIYNACNKVFGEKNENKMQKN